MEEKIFILIAILIILVTLIVLALKPEVDKANMKRQSQIDRQKKAFNRAIDDLNNFPAILMAKSVTSFVNLPENTLFTFTANNNYLTICSETSPITNFLLDYNRILKFQSIDTKELREELAGMYRVRYEREYIVKNLHLEYTTSEGDSIFCDFICGFTYEDRSYNEAAQKGEDIFEYVNARIPKKDNTVIL